MADTNSASRFGSVSIELRKELLSKAIPQNTKSCTKFSFNVFDGTSKSHSNFTRQPFYCQLAIYVFLVKLNLKTFNLLVYN